LSFVVITNDSSALCHRDQALPCRYCGFPALNPIRLHPVLSAVKTQFPLLIRVHVHLWSSPFGVMGKIPRRHSPQCPEVRQHFLPTAWKKSARNCSLVCSVCRWIATSNCICHSKRPPTSEDACQAGKSMKAKVFEVVSA
jgi:hypothetical protein